MPKETLPQDKIKNVTLTAARIVGKEIAARTLEQVAGITGSIAILTGQLKEGPLVRLAKGLLQKADTLRREAREIFPSQERE